MKVFQSKLTCMYGKEVTVDRVSGYPSDVYPNTHTYGYHDFFEMEFFAKGEGYHYINGVPYRVQPGYCYLLFPGDMHFMQLDCNAEFELWNLKFTEDTPDPRLIRELEGFSRPLCAYAGEESQLLLKEFTFLNDCIHGKLWNEGMSKNIVERLLVVMSYMLQKDRRPERVRADAPYWMLIEYIEKNYARPITLSDLAKLSGMSENYVGIYFKNHTGMRFADFLIKTRLFHASRLLRQTNLSVKEVAFRVGFGSAEYFCRLYKNAFGVPPSKSHK